MKRILWILALTAILIPSSVPAGQWQEVTSDEGRFSILMPGVPDHNEKNNEWIKGNDSDTIAYYLNYADMSEGDTRSDREILQAGMNGALKSSAKNKLVSKKFFLYKGYSACEFKITQSNLILLFHLTVVKHRMYTTGYSAEKSVYKLADANKFLNSLKFISPELNTGTAASSSTEGSADQTSSASVSNTLSGSVFTGESAEKWNPVVSDTGRFKALMPGIPQAGDDKWELSNKADSIYYSISYVDLAKDDTRESREVLSASVQGSAKGVKGSTLVSENYFKYQSFPACEYRINGADFDSLNRVYLVGHRLYIAVYVATKDLFSKTYAGKFHSSTQFLNTDLNTGK